MNPEQKTKFKAIQDAANLPAATREAQRLGLVPGQPQGPGPNQGIGGPRPRMQGPMMGPERMGPGGNGPRCARTGARTSNRRRRRGLRGREILKATGSLAILLLSWLLRSLSTAFTPAWRWPRNGSPP